MYQKTVLPNGIRVVTEKIPYLKSVTIGMWVGTGSRVETNDTHGISHFIEHLMFKGTENRTAKEIAETIDAVGGQLNAFTAKEYTCYYIKVIDTHIGLAVDVLSDMLLHSKFDPGDIIREQGVVLEEVNMYEDTPEELVHDIHVEKLWDGHPLGRNIIGTAESIEKFTQNMLQDYFKEFYTPDNLVVAAAGNLEHSTIVEMVERHLGEMKGTKRSVEYHPPILKPINTVRKKDIEQVHLCIGTSSVPQDTPQVYPVHLTNLILGGGISSRLFQTIREEHGLAYSIYSYQSNYRDSGLFTVYAGTRPSNTKQVIELIMDNIIQLKQSGVLQDELKRAKEQLKGNMLLGLESSSSRMTRLGKAEITLGKHIQIDEVIDKINKVSIEDTIEILKTMFNQDSICCTALGPIDDNEIFQVIKK